MPTRHVHGPGLRALDIHDPRHRKSELVGQLGHLARAGVIDAVMGQPVAFPFLPRNTLGFHLPDLVHRTAPVVVAGRGDAHETFFRAKDARRNLHPHAVAFHRHSPVAQTPRAALDRHLPTIGLPRQVRHTQVIRAGGDAEGFHVRPGQGDDLRAAFDDDEFLPKAHLIRSLTTRWLPESHTAARAPSRATSVGCRRPLLH